MTLKFHMLYNTILYHTKDFGEKWGGEEEGKDPLDDPHP